MRVQRFARHVLLLAIIVTLVFALWPTGIVNPYMSGERPHLVAFSVLSIIGFLAFPPRNVVLLGFGLILFGASIEALQWAMGVGRAAQWSDLLIDGMAITVTLILLSAVRFVGSAIWNRLSKSEPCDEKHGHTFSSGD